MQVADFPDWLLRGGGFLFAALFGSFFNVCIYRWPRGMSVVSPPSHCPACDAPIPGWRNVPVLGYLFLRGRAACCGAKMTPRYFFVELLTGLLGLALAERLLVQAPAGAEWQPALFQTVSYFFLVGGLIVATFIDLEWMSIPDDVTLPGTALGLMTVGAGLGVGVSQEDALIGAGCGFLVVQMVFVWAYERLTGRRGMGEGDSKLLMMIGAFLGWQGALFALVAGSFQGIAATALAYVSNVNLEPKQASSIVEDWSKEDLLDLLESVFRRHPKIAAEFDIEQDDEPEPAVTAVPHDALDTDTDTDTLRKSEGADEPNPSSVAAEANPSADGEPNPSDDAAQPSSDEDQRPPADAAGDEPSTDEAVRGPRKIPFGPFLALAALEYLFFGDRIVGWYFGLF